MEWRGRERVKWSGGRGLSGVEWRERVKWSGVEGEG